MFREFFKAPRRSRTMGRRDPAGAAQHRPVPCRLGCEALEDRAVPASLSVNPVYVIEGNAGTQHAVATVWLSAPVNKTVTVNYRTANGTAVAGSDFTAASGTLTFAPGQTSKSIVLPVTGDRVAELDETFSVMLSGAKNATIRYGQGVVTIQDDEPRISTGDAWPSEGNFGSTPCRFTVNLSRAYDLPVTVNYTTADGSASAGSDYTAASGSATFMPGQTSQTIALSVNGDRLPEPNETFFVNVSSPNSHATIDKGVGVGTIVDDEPRISIDNAINYGGSSFMFTVFLLNPSAEVVTVNFATVDGTAIAGVDYLTTSGTLTFLPGQTSQSITVYALVDPISAAGKSFTVQLSNASPNALIGNASAIGYWMYDWYDGGYDSYSGGGAGW